MFPRSEFRSIWEIAHDWVGADPNQPTPEDLPDEVQEHIQLLIWAYIRKKITLRLKRSADSWHLIQPNDLLLLFFNLNRARVKLVRMLQTGDFDRKFLDAVFANRAEVLKWCEDSYRTEPPMWRRSPALGDGPHGNQRTNLTKRDIDKNRCQAIALTFWDFDQSIPPAHIAQSYAVRKFGNGDQYRDDDTVKNWVNEVDPLKGNRKSGRPRTPNYKIDLKLPV